MSNFTKGQWHYDGGRFVKNDADKIIADMLPVLDYVDSLEEIAAIARLIATAPEMYDELYKHLQFFKGKVLYYAEYARSTKELLARIDGEEVQA